MGFFDLFKKKKAVTWEVTENRNHNYDPWENSKVSRNDNYAIAAFIHISRNGAKIGRTKDDYARYLNYTFKVNDPIKYHKQVIADGYLVEASPEVSLRKFKVDQLKAILTKANLPDKGKKDELITRIVENIDVNTLNLEKVYVPSEKGLEHLKKYEFVLSLRNYGISWEEYDKFKQPFPDHFKPNDIIWKMLNDRYNQHNLNGDFGLARNELLNSAKLLESEKKYIDTLYHYIIVLYYDTSGCGNNYIAEKPDSLAPGVVSSIHELKQYYEDRMVDKCFTDYRLPHHYMTKTNFKRLLFDIFEDEAITLKKYL